jgi:acyl carrier protein
VTKEQIIEETKSFMVEEFEIKIEDIHPDAILRDTLGLDSLDYVDLVVSIESKFGVKLVEADFVGISTFESFYDLIEKKLIAKGS